MGTCAYCDAEAVVTVNDKAACADHLDDVMAEAFEPLREARRLLTDGGGYG